MKSAFKLGMLGIIIIAVLSPLFLEGESESEDSDKASSSEAVDARVERSIDRWTRRWSESQAASLRETCAENPDCDPSQYKASAEPETSFGWEGASEITQTSDWAEGRRYTAVANGRKLLFFFDGGKISGVYEIDGDSKDLVCRDADCDVY